MSLPVVSFGCAAFTAGRIGLAVARKVPIRFARCWRLCGIGYSCRNSCCRHCSFRGRSYGACRSGHEWRNRHRQSPRNCLRVHCRGAGFRSRFYPYGDAGSHGRNFPRIPERRNASTVIGDVEARGICGSGLVDAVAAGLGSGAILTSGRIANGTKEFPVQAPVILYQADIRELQLAKSAIASGFRLLIKHLGATAGDVQSVHLAGALGTMFRSIAPLAWDCWRCQRSAFMRRAIRRCAGPRCYF